MQYNSLRIEEILNDGWIRGSPITQERVDGSVTINPRQEAGGSGSGGEVGTWGSQSLRAVTTGCTVHGQKTYYS